jgi:hypothetical protein
MPEPTHAEPVRADTITALLVTDRTITGVGLIEPDYRSALNGLVGDEPRHADYPDLDVHIWGGEGGYLNRSATILHTALIGSGRQESEQDGLFGLCVVTGTVRDSHPTQLPPRFVSWLKEVVRSRTDLRIAEPLFAELEWMTAKPKTVRVFLNPHTDFVTDYLPDQEVVEVTSYTEHGDDDLALLEEAFRLFNVGHDPDIGPVDDRALTYRHRGNRSLSVGDVVGIDDRYYTCGSFGWIRLVGPPTTTSRAGNGITPKD